MSHDKILENLKTKSKGNPPVALLLHDFVNEKLLYDNGMVEQGYWDNYLMEVNSRVKDLEDEKQRADMPDKVVNSRRIFISYSGKDREITEKVFNYLQNHPGAEIFWDKVSMEAGEEIGKRLEMEIQAAEFFLIMVSANSLRSSWVNKEAMMACMNNESGLGARIIPIVIEDSFYDNNTLLRKEIMDFFDSKVKELSGLTKERVDKESGEDVFRSPLEDYKTQRRNFTKVINMLNDRATVRMTEGHFETAMEKIVQLFSK